MAGVIHRQTERAILQDLATALGVSESCAVETLGESSRSVLSGTGMSSWIRRAFIHGAAEVVVANLGSIDGRISRIESGYRIELNSRRPKSRQLFSLAHELGHLLLERHLPYLRTGSKERSLFCSDYNLAEERVADMCAAAMLMPSQTVGEFLRNHNDRLTAAVAICREFGVSLSSACRRISEVGDCRLTPMDFELDPGSDVLKLTNGAWWRLPFRDCISSQWQIPLSQELCTLGLGQTINTLIPVETHPGFFEHFRAEFRWLNRFRAVAAFSYEPN